jgi:hypothetical protein
VKAAQLEVARDNTPNTTSAVTATSVTKDVTPQRFDQRVDDLWRYLDHAAGLAQKVMEVRTPSVSAALVTAAAAAVVAEATTTEGPKAPKAAATLAVPISNQAWAPPHEKRVGEDMVTGGFAARGGAGAGGGLAAVAGGDGRASDAAQQGGDTGKAFEEERLDDIDYDSDDYDPLDQQLVQRLKQV